VGTTLSAHEPEGPPTRSPFRAHWIDDSNPEDEGVWARTGAKIAPKR